VVDEFSADYIFDACGKVVELVKAFKQPAAGNRAGREHRVRGVSRFRGRRRCAAGGRREEDTMYPEASEVGGGG
jgi:IS5 family transposase